jgi:hypothetical protein
VAIADAASMALDNWPDTRRSATRKQANATLEQKATNLINDAAALTDRRPRTQCGACRSN